VRSQVPLAIRLTALFIAALAPAAAANQPSYQYRAVAVLGTRAAGGGALRGGFEPGALDSQSRLAYVAGIGSRGAQGLFLDTLGTATPVARPGNAAGDGWVFAEQPGLIGGIASPVAMNAEGDLVFAADITRGTEQGSGTFRWVWQTEELSALSLPGQTAPNGALFGNTHSPASINDQGDIAFAVEVSGGTAPEEGLFLLSEGKLTPLVLPGDSEPGGGKFASATHPSVNAARQVAFQADVVREGRRSTGVFLADSTGIHAIADPRRIAPGGGSFLGAREAHLNNRGQLAFLGNTGAWAAYLANGDQITRLTGPGSVLPGGAPVHAVITTDGSLSLNQSGAVAMLLKVEEPDAAGLFVWQQETLWPVALPGTFLAGIGPIDSVGTTVALNDQGQVAFEAQTDDGDAALVLATPVTAGQ
jgi:hypothetical protein